MTPPHRGSWRLWTLLPALLMAAPPAFAQIEGYGKDATGGQGRPVCTVTSGAESGAGTFDDCVSNGGNQTIQFAVSSATVRTASHLESNTTIDGCANGQTGVTLNMPADTDRSVILEGPISNVIVRCIRFQGSGPKKPGFSTENDLLALDGESGLVSTVVVDRCTFVGATDGALDLTGNVSNVTVSRNLFYGTPLTQLIKYDTRQKISIHHNVYTAGGERNPQIKGNARDIDFVSNVIYGQTITSDELGNGFDPYGTSLRNAGSGSDSQGNVKANVRSSFWGGSNSTLEIDTESGASAAAIYIAPDNVCAGGCPASPAALPNVVPAAFAITPTAVNCLASLMLPSVGSPNRTSTDQARLNAVASALPGGCTATTFALAVAKIGAGGGTVTSTPPGISCGADCAETVDAGTVVTLSQAAAAGSVFAGWSGACTGTGACQVTMNAARAVTATFNLTPKLLSVVRAGSGSGTVTSSPPGIACGADCADTYAPGTVVALSQNAAAGSTFMGWSGGCTGGAGCLVTMDAAKSVTATFTLDSGLPTVSIVDESVTEGDAGYKAVLVRLNLSAPVTVPVKVTYSTHSATARSARDFVAATGSLVFPEGTTAGQLALWTSGDLSTEEAETFTVTLRSPENANLGRDTATVTILDNDPMPALTIADVLFTERHVGSRNALFKVTLSAVAPADVSVTWTTEPQTATAGADYTPMGGTLVIPKGKRTGTIAVPLLGDLADERNEAFLVRLSGATNARIVDGQAQGVIWDDDGEKDQFIPIASLPYEIKRPGRYRLVSNLTFAGTQGAAVTVSTNNVVLDLEGHTLSGTGGPATQAVGVLARNRSGVTLENGTVQGFLTGVFMARPYAMASKFVVRNLHVLSSTYAGIWLEGRGNAVEACEVVGTGGSTALDPGAGAVGITSVGSVPKLTQNQVRNTAANGGDAFGIAVDRGTGGTLSGNLVENTSPTATRGILVTRATKASVVLNTLDTLDVGIVFTSGSNGTCTGNSITGVATPTFGVTCVP